MHTRLTRDGAWSRIKQVCHSAGVRKLQWPTWEPETPSLRVRKSLITPLGPEERLLYGHNALVLSMRNLQPTRFELSLSAAALGNLPMQPVRIAYQQGELPPQHVSVSRGEPARRLQLEIPAGSQYLRLWIEEPIANHYVRLGIHEIPDSDRVVPESDLHRTERIYEVATHEEPLRLDVEGPAWLRIDELRDGETYTQYLDIVEARREIELTPRDD
jgi:hypothetical protein